MCVTGTLTAHPVSYHQQDNGQFCGPASAQMVLGSLGPGLHQQGDLFALIREPTPGSGWASPPDRLANTIESLKPAGFPVSFSVVPHPSVDSISRHICWAIHHHGVAPIVLVNGESHWLVVTEFVASDWPASADDTTYSIEAFYIHNPVPPLPTGVEEPPHVVHDGCGTGDHRGTPNEHVVYAAEQGVAGSHYWQTYYMSSAATDGQYLAICPNDVPANTQDAPLESEGERITNTDVIVQRAREGLDAYGLANREPWASALQGTLTPETFLVEREDVASEPLYYIVAFRNNAGDVPILAMVSAYEHGGYAGSIAAPIGATTHFGRALDRDGVNQRYAGTTVGEGENAVTLEEGNLLGHLVWRPCEESLSPYWPFYRFNPAGPGNRGVAYVRIDGERFTALHEGKGM
jgi:hypothetical protein